MKYIIILWYMITPPLGDSAHGSGHEEMPNVYGAAVEPLDFQKTIVILGRFNTKEACETEMDNLAYAHLYNLDTRRTIKGIQYDCFVDPKE